MRVVASEVETVEGRSSGAGLPEAISEMAPGPELALVLAGVDRACLNGYELVVLLEARSRQVAFDQAELYSDMVELAYCPPSFPGAPARRQQMMDEFAVDEVRAVLRWTRKAADWHMDLAWRLVERLPAVWEALRAGRIDLARARVIVHGTDHLDKVVAREVAASILPAAENLTTGAIAARLRRLCAEIDSDDAARRYAEGVAGRRVLAVPNPDGTADLFARQLPVERLAAIMSRIHDLARSLKASDDLRSVDQIRADILMDLLESNRTQGGHRRAMVDIRVDLTTLLELAESPGEIPGWGPVIADIARQVVERQPNGEWRVVVTDPDSGTVLWDGTTRRRPSAAQRRHVEARQTTCVFPGCRNPARRADLDHTVDSAKGGPTLVDNLGPACRHDHRLKHEGGWQIEQPKPGTYLWTSRHAHTYQVDRPP